MSTGFDEEGANSVASVAIAAFGELFSLVKEAVNTVSAFKSELKKIESTLRLIEPIIKHWGKQNKRLNEIAPIKDLFDRGKRLVEICSNDHWYNVVKEYNHSKELIEFDAELLRDFELYLPLVNELNVKEIREDVKEIERDMKEMKVYVKGIMDYLSSMQANNQAIKDHGIQLSGDLKVIRK